MTAHFTNTASRFVGRIQQEVRGPTWCPVRPQISHLCLQQMGPGSSAGKGSCLQGHSPETTDMLARIDCRPGLLHVNQ